MLLSSLAKDASIPYAGPEAEILSVEYDSRRVVPGSLFCCCVGLQRDGHDFAASAVERGAVALVTERPLPLDVPQLVTEDARKAMALLSAAFYGHPERQMKMLGVTGTNGKTSTTYMVKAIAEQAGLKVGIIGTIRNMIGDRSLYTMHTTPESADLYGILRTMADDGVDLVVMEVSSHALEQSRVHGICFDEALFTNLTQDHLDYHKTFENYLNAKKILFRNARSAIVNLDDPYALRMTEGLSLPVTTFGIREKADFGATNIDITARGVRFDLSTPAGELRLHLPIPGLFSVFNAMGAAALALGCGLSLKNVKDGLEGMAGVSGRLEPVDTGLPFSVFVDYAHTPDALENVLKAVRQFAKGRILCVFGCGGNRDAAKRPIMGEIAGRYSDYAIITSDNPRTEDPMTIIAAIEEGVRRSGTAYTVVEKRLDAIRHALTDAQPGDTVLIAGKGHETYQEINGTRYHFDDKEAVLTVTAELMTK